MAYCSKKKWIAFSRGVQSLRRRLRILLEGILKQPITDYEGSDSVIYEPGHWSKYKLVPYDSESMPPLTGLDEGVLICIDKKTCDNICNGKSLTGFFSGIPWNNDPLTYCAYTNPSRTYQVIPISMLLEKSNLSSLLADVAEVIR